MSEWSMNVLYFLVYLLIYYFVSSDSVTVDFVVKFSLT